MTNNSGDMTNNISDERLRELVEKCNSSDWQAPKERCSYGLYINELEQMASELLSARETIAEKDKLIERLVEDGEGMAGVILRLKNYMSPDGNYSFCAKGGGLLGMGDQMLIGQVCEDGDNALDQHTALLAKLEGKGFDAAMKRVLDENKGAWKALGGEEGKG